MDKRLLVILQGLKVWLQDQADSHKRSAEQAGYEGDEINSNYDSGAAYAFKLSAKKLEDIIKQVSNV